MTVLSDGGERSGTDGRSGGSLTERMAGLQRAWVLTRMGRCAGVVEGAGRAWEEKRCAGLTVCGCAGPVTWRGAEVRTQRPGEWKLLGEWCAAGFGRRKRKRRRD